MKKRQYILFILIFTLLVISFYYFLDNKKYNNERLAKFVNYDNKNFEISKFDEIKLLTNKAIREKNIKYCTIGTESFSYCVDIYNDFFLTQDILRSLMEEKNIPLNKCFEIKNKIYKDVCELMINNYFNFKSSIRSKEKDSCNNFNDKSLISSCEIIKNSIDLISKKIDNCEYFTDNSLFYLCKRTKYIINLGRKELCDNLLSHELEEICISKSK